MKSFGRDISVTLIFKIILLILLWYFVLKGPKPVTLSNEEWLLGMSFHQTPKHTQGGGHDTRR